MTWHIDVPEYHYSTYHREPVADVTVAQGYEYEAEQLTAAECRDLANDLMETARKLKLMVVEGNRDRMTNYSPARHRTPFEPYELKVAKGTATCFDHLANGFRVMLMKSSYGDGAGVLAHTWQAPAGEWEQKDDVTQVKRYR